MTRRVFALSLSLYTLLLPATSSAEPAPANLSDQNTKIAFEVHAPWNILDGTAEEVSGNSSIAGEKSQDSLKIDIAAQKIDYRAGVSVAGRLVAAWLRLNSPTPARFVIGKSTFDCKPEALSEESSCRGSVDGQLTIWAKSYKLDVPVEIKRRASGILLTGIKKIQWGEYGFGEPDSTISHLKPVIDLNFSIEIPSVRR